MKNKKTLMIVTIVIMSIIVLMILLKKDLWEVNEELFKQEVLAIGDSVETVNLSDLTPFEWELVYAFDPYTPKETIYETVGYKWGYIRETVNEGMNQIVFLNDGKVVCYLYGYPENNGYGLNFVSGKNGGVTSASVLRAEDDLTFQVVKSDGVIYLGKDEGIKNEVN